MDIPLVNSYLEIALFAQGIILFLVAYAILLKKNKENNKDKKPFYEGQVEDMLK